MENIHFLTFQIFWYIAKHWLSTCYYDFHRQNLTQFFQTPTPPFVSSLSAASNPLQKMRTPFSNEISKIYLINPNN